MTAITTFSNVFAGTSAKCYFLSPDATDRPQTFRYPEIWLYCTLQLWGVWASGVWGFGGYRILGVQAFTSFGV